MSVQPYDKVTYHGHVCVVEQVWITSDDTHTPFCCLRRLEDEHGTYIVEQSAVQHYHYGQARAA